MVNRLPYEFVDSMIDPGLDTNVGLVPLSQYMSSNRHNGDNDNTHNLMKNMRWFKEGGKGPMLDDMVGRTRMELVIKGQGRPDDFVKVWNFMCKNKNQLDTYRINVGYRPRSNRSEFIVQKHGTVYDLYFKNHSDATALSMMVEDRFFGMDCIGFLANYLIEVGVWSEYQAYEPARWDRVFTQEVKSTNDVEALNLLLWKGHVAIVDWVWDYVDDRTVKVDICQCSRGGPQCNEHVYLQKINSISSKGYQLYKVLGAGTPRMPVDEPMSIMRMPGLFW